jgi:hypothetical protein
MGNPPSKEFFPFSIIINGENCPGKNEPPT